MSKPFLELLNMSIVASWIVLAVLVLRLFLKKAPRWIACFLWAIVGLRLLFPFSIESMFSLLPSGEPIPEDLFETNISPNVPSDGMQSVPDVNEAYGTPPHEISYREPLTVSDSPASSLDEPGIEVHAVETSKEGVLHRLLSISTVVWAVGTVLMACYAAYSYFRIRRKVRLSIAVREKLYLCDYIETPFILGIIRPRIYVPSALTDRESLSYVLAHEEAHLKRFDYLWKPLGYALLTVYWFNPLMWLAYTLLCRDIEIACDERVVKNMKASEKIKYTHALLQCSVPRKMISACPLAFGEVQVKERVKTVLHYKKPAFWIIIVSMIACLVLSVGFLTNPKEEKDTSTEDNSDISELMVSDNRSEDALSDDENIESESEGVTSEESSEESDPDSDRTSLPDGEISAEFRSIAVNSIGSVREAAEEADCFYAETESGIDIVKFDTCSQLNLFAGHLQEDAEGNQAYIYQINTFTEPYDEQFFENNSLLVLVTREASGGNENHLNSVYRQSGTLTFYMEKVFGVTADTKILFNCLEFKKEEIAYCTEFSIEMTLREEYSLKTVDIQHVNLSPEEVAVYLNYTNKELHTETFLLCLDRAEDVQSLKVSLDDASPLAFALSVYDETFFEENSLYLFYSQQASVDDDLEPAKYMTVHRSLVAGTFYPLAEELEIEIEFGKNLSSNNSPVPQLLLFGLERNEWSDVSYRIEKDTFVEIELEILNVSAEHKDLLRELLSEAGDGAILIGINGQKTVLPADGVADSLYQHADSFVETTEGHLYDGIIEVWVIYGDGTIFGMYPWPSESVPEAYASCVGRIYGVQYQIDLIDDIVHAKTIYGYLPTEASKLPFEQIGY